jgi:hypothetical protein
MMACHGFPDKFLSSFQTKGKAQTGKKALCTLLLSEEVAN